MNWLSLLHNAWKNFYAKKKNDAEHDTPIMFPKNWAGG